MLQAGAAGAIGTTGTPTSPANSSEARSEVLAAAASLARAANVPAGPVRNVSECPLSPEMSSPLPAGAYVTGPTLTPQGTRYVQGGKTTDEANLCEYTIHLVSPDASVSTYSLGNQYAALGTEYSAAYYNGASGDCNADYKINNFNGDGYAGLELVSGACAHGADYVYSNYQVENGFGVIGDTEFLGTFGGSLTYAPGQYPNVYAGQYSICMESPQGTPPVNNYECAIVNYGPDF